MYSHLTRVLDSAWPKEMKLTLEQQYMLSVLQSFSCQKRSYQHVKVILNPKPKIEYSYFDLI